MATYTNPILPGDYPDPSILRVGEDYFLTHSSFRYGPGLLIWHSRDLVNWTRQTYAIPHYAGNVYAPDFVRHGDKFYIYYNADGRNWVIVADAPLGPWSDPHEIGVNWIIDPGHGVDAEGNRYMHLAGGRAVPLTADGLHVARHPGGPARETELPKEEAPRVYEGWPIPEEWPIETFALEGPKLFWRNGWCYLISAEGGTAGPATSHMVIAARSRHPLGPWENAPHNPIVHTASREETWWSQGHGTLVETPGGEWWLVYHAYRKGYHTLGRQTLMLPVVWMDDDWFQVPAEALPDQPLPSPYGTTQARERDWSDDFTGKTLDLRWQFFGGHDPQRYTLGAESLWLQGQGERPETSCPLVCIPAHTSYQLTVELSVPEGAAQAGLILFYNEHAANGLGWDGESLYRFKSGQRRTREREAPAVDRVWLRLRNEEHEASAWISTDGVQFTRVGQVFEVSGMHHNVFDGFLSLRVGLYVCGAGRARFHQAHYEVLSVD